jgi:hypothetical protein
LPFTGRKAAVAVKLGLATHTTSEPRSLNGDSLVYGVTMRTDD